MRFLPRCVFFYALFYALCLYKNMSGITFPFFHGRDRRLFGILFSQVRYYLEKKETVIH
jgi:hypothetical protein